MTERETVSVPRKVLVQILDKIKKIRRELEEKS